MIYVIEATKNPTVMAGSIIRTLTNESIGNEAVAGDASIKLAKSIGAVIYSSLARDCADTLEVADHISVTVSIKNYSIKTLKKIASFSKLSMQYEDTDLSTNAVFIPTAIKKDDDMLKAYYSSILGAFNSYKQQIDKGVSKKIAFCILPEATYIKAIATFTVKDIIVLINNYRNGVYSDSEELEYFIIEFISTLRELSEEWRLIAGGRDE